MEFPNLGKHCSHISCNKLDFLPVKCDACSKIFCEEHQRFEDHDCPGASARDVQVPVCPLCNSPVPSKRGQPPDLAVSAHIDRDCQADKSKVYTNRCSVKGCKKKEIVSFVCSTCHNNYCISHRHPVDHHCQPKNSIIQRSALNDSSTLSSRNRLFEAFQGNMDEDEALARGLALSMGSSDREEHRYREMAPRQTTRNHDSNCVIS